MQNKMTTNELSAIRIHRHIETLEQERRRELLMRDLRIAMLERRLGDDDGRPT